MFLRKFLVIAVPLCLCIALCLLYPLLGTWFVAAGFFGNVIKGVLLGVALALLLPLSGASRFREPFAGLLWVPTLVLVLVLAFQFASLQGFSLPVFDLLATQSAQIVLIEGAFIGFMVTTQVRTRA